MMIFWRRRAFFRAETRRSDPYGGRGVRPFSSTQLLKTIRGLGCLPKCVTEHAFLMMFKHFPARGLSMVSAAGGGSSRERCRRHSRHQEPQQLRPSQGNVTRGGTGTIPRGAPWMNLAHYYFTFLPIASLFLEASHQQGAHTACPRPPHPHRNQNKALSFLSNKNTVTRDLVPREGGRQHKQKLWSCDSSVPIKRAATAGSHTRQQDPSALGVRPASTRVTR